MEKTNRTTISRLAKRGTYDLEIINNILDEGLFCHIAYVLEGKPFIIPTGYCRIDDHLYIHGSVGSHFLRELAKGLEVCLTVSLLDGLVLARSAFHHSVNYRSVVVFSKAQLIEDEEARWEIVKQFTEHMIPGRWANVRLPDKGEMKNTMIIAFDITEASAKMHVDGVNDDPEDKDFDVWAGVLPLTIQPGVPQPDSELKPGMLIPHYISSYKRH